MYVCMYVSKCDKESLKRGLLDVNFLANDNFNDVIFLFSLSRTCDIL